MQNPCLAPAATQKPGRGTLAEEAAAAEKRLQEERDRIVANENMRIKMALDSLPECVTVSNADAAFVHATPAAEELLKKLGGPGFNLEKPVRKQDQRLVFQS